MNLNKIPSIPPDLFTKVKEIGEGGFGVVLLCNFKMPDGSTEKRAVKTLYEHDQKMFEREIEPYLELKHPNLVRIYGITRFDPYDGIVTEFMDGGNLNDVIHARAPSYSLKDILNWSKQSAKALEYMHGFQSANQKTSSGKRYIHRDIKPENMLLNSTRELLKISDFGASKIIDNSENTGGQGTDIYMAPEVILKKPYNETCDVYSWTLTLWECLTRTRPFMNYKTMENYRKIKNTENYLAKVDTASDKLNMLIRSGISIHRHKRISMSSWRMILEIMIKNCNPLEKDEQKELHVCVWDKQTPEEFFYCKGLDKYDFSKEIDPKSIEEFLKNLENK